MRWFFFIVCLILVSTFGYAIPLISDGSFEENCVVPNCTYNSTQTIGNDWFFTKIQGNTQFQIISDSNIASDGEYYGKLENLTTVSRGEVRNLFELNGGIIYFDVNDFSTGSGDTTTFRINYYPTDGGVDFFTLLNTKVGVTGSDKNIFLPNERGFISFGIDARSIGNGSFAKFDNIRYERYPVIIKNGYQVIFDQPFRIDANFTTGASCSITDVETGVIYSAIETSNGVYQSSPIIVSSNTNLSKIKQFSVTCDGKKNNYDYWKIKIDKSPLINQSGSFENICSSNQCVYSSTQNINEDWKFIVIQGSPNLTINKDNSGEKHATSGLFYANLSGSSPARGEIRSTRLLNGGTVYLDVNSFSYSSSGKLRINYYLENGTLSETLYNSNTEVIGFDKNIQIPNYEGLLGIGIDTGGGGTAQAIIDDIRYENPKYGSCFPVRVVGDPSNKIDLVFIGSGFDDINQLRSMVDFVIDYNSNESGLFSFEPFKTYKDKFNIWYVDSFKEYQMTKANENSAWRFGDDVLNNAKTACGIGEEFSLLAITPRFGAYAPYLFADGVASPIPQHMNYVGLGCEALGTCNLPYDFNVLDPTDDNCEFETPECSMDSNTLSGKQMVFAHEFGHSFGGLYDEYKTTDEDVNTSTGTIANCDHTLTCSKWNPPSLGTGCFDICGNPDWHRPFQHTIMGEGLRERDEFKAISESRLAEKILNYPVNQIVDSLSMLLVKLNRGIDTVLGAQSVSYLQTAAPANFNDSNIHYSAQLLSSNNQVLYDFNFVIPNVYLHERHGTLDANGHIATDVNGNPILTDNNTVEVVNDINSFITLPYISGGTKVNVYDTNGDFLFMISLLPYLYEYSFILGNGGEDISSANYNMKYTLQNGISGKIEGSNYKAQIGWEVYHE